MKLGNCECGCGNVVTKGKRFVSGHNGRGKRKIYNKFNCEYCKTDFEVRPHIKNRKYCSNNCRDEYRKSRTGVDHPLYNRTDVPCEICGTIVLVTKSRLKNKTHAYCSAECGREAHKRSLTGRPRSNNRSGKYAARVRDGGKCVLCGFSVVTNVHHIIRKKDGGSNDLTNLVTLCPNHHHMVHARMITTEELKKHATAFSFHENIPIVTKEYRSKGADFRNPL
jgi:endogenous inhibitor of DNA gyrase (YacG/DUF329 family)